MFGKRHPALSTTFALALFAALGAALALAGQQSTASTPPANSHQPTESQMASTTGQPAAPGPAAGGRQASSLRFTPQVTGPSFPVLGGGSSGRLTKWLGLSGSNSFIGDTSIFE